MKRLKPDVSHRIRPRAPSIFSAGWFRLLLGSGIAVVLGLVVGPSIADWLGTDLPRSVRLVAPWSGPRGEPVVADPATGPGVVARDVTPQDVAAQPVPVSVVTRSAGPPAAAPPAAAGGAAATATPPAPLFRIQVGAFLDHRNADRLVERLRGEGLGAATSVFEQSRILYGVLAIPGDSEGASATLLETLRALGFTAAATEEGLAVTELVPLRTAVEVSHRLREQSITVRLKQEVGSTTFRVVRVGSYATSDEADRALVTLAARGFDGVVVRER